MSRKKCSLLGDICLFYWWVLVVSLVFMGELRAQSGSGSSPDFDFGISRSFRDSLLIVEAWGRNHTAREGNFEYRLLTSKSGPNGSSNTSQSGKVNLPAHHKAVFATVKLKVRPDDVYKIEFLVFNNSRLISKVIFKYPQDQKEGP